MDYYKIRELAYPYYYVVSILGIFLSISGTILCNLVLHLILKNKWKTLSIDLKLICFTLVFDLLMCLYVFISDICSIVGFADYLNSRLSCTINAIVSVLIGTTSVNLVGVIALQRYLLIVKEKVYHNRIYYMIIIGLQMVNLISFAISGAFEGFSINSTSIYCIYDFTNWAGIAGTIVLALSFSTSITLTYFSYVNIMVKRRKLTLKNQKIFPFKAEKIKKEANSTIIKSALIIIASTVTNLPYDILLFIALINPKFLTPQVQSICSILNMLNGLINALLVLRLRTDLWNQFKAIILLKPGNREAYDESIDDYQLKNIEIDINGK